MLCRVLVPGHHTGRSIHTIIIVIRSKLPRFILQGYSTSEQWPKAVQALKHKILLAREEIFIEEFSIKPLKELEEMWHPILHEAYLSRPSRIALYLSWLKEQQRGEHSQEYDGRKARRIVSLAVMV